MSKNTVWRAANGWREIFARIFDGVTTQFNVSPNWLVNPASNRRLKLDMLYPELQVAVRFDGVRGSKQRRHRLSLEEEVQVRFREDARVTVCREHGVHLVVVDMAEDNFGKIFQQIDMALSRAAQQAPGAELRQQIKQARRSTSLLAMKIRSLSDLNLYADLWTDRQYRLAEPQAAPPPAVAVDFSAGVEVEHTVFGSGVVLQTTPGSDGDTLITVDFVTAGQKTLAASLVGGKLFPKQAG